MVLLRQQAGAHADQRTASCVSVLAMAYHNAGVEHERLGRLQESLVSFTR